MLITQATVDGLLASLMPVDVIALFGPAPPGRMINHAEKYHDLRGTSAGRYSNMAAASSTHGLVYVDDKGKFQCLFYVEAYDQGVGSDPTNRTQTIGGVHLADDFSMKPVAFEATSLRGATNVVMAKATAVASGFPHSNTPAYDAFSLPPGTATPLEWLAMGGLGGINLLDLNTHPVVTSVPRALLMAPGKVALQGNDATPANVAALCFNGEGDQLVTDREWAWLSAMATSNILFNNKCLSRSTTFTDGASFDLAEVDLTAIPAEVVCHYPHTNLTGVTMLTTNDVLYHEILTGAIVGLHDTLVLLQMHTPQPVPVALTWAHPVMATPPPIAPAATNPYPTTPAAPILPVVPPTTPPVTATTATEKFMEALTTRLLAGNPVTTTPAGTPDGTTTTITTTEASAHLLMSKCFYQHLFAVRVPDGTPKLLDISVPLRFFLNLTKKETIAKLFENI